MSYPVSTSIHLYLNLKTINEQIKKHIEAGFKFLDFNFLDWMVDEASPFMNDGWEDWILSAKKTAEENGAVFNQAHAPVPAFQFSNDYDGLVACCRRAIKACDMLGIRQMVYHALVYPKDYGFDMSWLDVNKKFFGEILEDAKKYNVGICIEKNGKQRVIFSIYDNNGGREYTSVIYTEDGETWHRSEKAKQVGAAGKSSESQMVLLNNGVLRMYSRNIAGYISYTDSTDGGETWGKYTIDKGLGYCSNCMFSVINYSKEIDGKKAIILACPSTKTRKLGVIKIGLYDENNVVSWKYRKKVTDSLNPFSYVYSCITELPDGNIADLYESDKAEFSLKGYTIDELKANDKTKLSLVDSIKSKIYNKTRK